MNMPSFFLGLDSSTQSLSALIIDLDSRQIVYEADVNFDEALPHYGTKNGTLPSDDPQVVHSPPLMWVEALDLLLQKMQNDGAPLGDVKAISGSSQQHGSVYLNATAPAILANLTAEPPLTDQLRGIFSRETAPIWMDSSTSVECEEIEAALGGKAATAEATGSAAFERFTGPQIRKFAKTEPKAFEQTSHIALVSSFMASILAGRIAPIDSGDGAGMNLMDIHTKTWHPAALDAVFASPLRIASFGITQKHFRNTSGPNLGIYDAGGVKKLPKCSNPWKIIGPILPTLGKKYGFAADTLCTAWSGDNPNSVVGLGLIEPGMTAISLGTSDTFFGTLRDCQTDPNAEGHVFGSPTGDYMSLICFKNGSLAREKVKDQYGLDWAGFSTALESTPPGNGGKMMLPYFEPEIVPRVLEPGVRRFGGLDKADAAANCRAVVEAQMMSMRIHSQWMGEPPTKIYATGGASANSQILQIMADVFQCPVYRQETPNSAALGAALRAAHAWHLHNDNEMPWKEIVCGFTDPQPDSRIEPDPETALVYEKLCAEYQAKEPH